MFLLEKTIVFTNQKVSCYRRALNLTHSGEGRGGRTTSQISYFLGTSVVLCQVIFKFLNENRDCGTHQNYCRSRGVDTAVGATTEAEGRLSVPLTGWDGGGGGF